MGAGGDAVGVFAVDGVEGAEEGFRFGAKAEQESGAEDTGEAEMVVVHRPEPVLGAAGEVGGALDDEAGGGGDLAESVEAEHALEGLAEAILHREGGVEGTDGGGIEDGRGGVGAGGLRQGEKPLNEVVDGFKAVVVPGEDVGEGTAFIVGGAIAIEGDEGMWGRAQR